MTAKILDGKLLGKVIQDRLRQDVLALKEKTGRVPRLINVMIGKDPGSCAYANSQKRVAQQIGIEYELVNVPLTISQQELLDYIDDLNADDEVHGVMIHKPVPNHIDYRQIGNSIYLEKDLEGINIKNIGKMMLGETSIIPCTPAAIMEHIKSTFVNIRGKETVIVGASEIVGKPLSLLLLREYATVTVCHIATSEAHRLRDHISRAEILVVAVGKPEFIKGEWIKEGAIVIDVGINPVGERILGDVEFSVAQQRAAYITPVPGGVGPVTVVMLMRNGIEAYKLQTLNN